MKGEACEERRKDSYLSCLLGPERQARTEERNRHCFRHTCSGPLMTQGHCGPIYGTHVAFTGRGSPLLAYTRTQTAVEGAWVGVGVAPQVPTQGSSGPEPGELVPIHPGRKELTSGSRHWVKGQGPRQGETGRWAQAPSGVHLCADTRTNKCALTALCWVLETGPAMFPWQHHQTVGDGVSREWEGPGRASWHQSPERRLQGGDKSAVEGRRPGRPGTALVQRRRRGGGGRGQSSQASDGPSGCRQAIKLSS